MGWTVPRVWVGDTVVCLASGPSLTPADVDFVRGKARVIAVNNNYQLAPWADVLYAHDRRWWQWHHGAPTFHGLKIGIQRVPRYADLHYLKLGPPTGLSRDPGIVHHGRNSGYQAINVAVHFGVARIVLLGYDMHRTWDRAHWHRDHPIPTPDLYRGFRRNYETLVEPLRAAGVEVINATRDTALTCFPRAPLETLFAGALERAS